MVAVNGFSWGADLAVIIYSPDSSPEPDWDQRRFAHLEARTHEVFPSFDLATRPLSGDGAVATMSAAPEQRRGFWATIGDAVRNFFVVPTTAADLIDAQKTVLHEIADVHDPRFLDLLLSITSLDVRLGSRLTYDPAVLELADQASAQLLPALTVPELMRFAAHTEQRLARVKDFWTYLNATRNESLGGAAIQRITALRDETQRLIALRVNVTTSPTVETSYQATHYRTAAAHVLDTPGRVGRGMWSLVERSNPVNLIPRSVVGMAMFLWDGVTNIPAEVGGLATAGAYGDYGAELGQHLGDSVVAVASLAKAAPRAAELTVKITVNSHLRLAEGLVEKFHAAQEAVRPENQGRMNAQDRAWAQGELRMARRGLQVAIISLQRAYELATRAGMYESAAQAALARGVATLMGDQTAENFAEALNDFQRAFSAAGKAGNVMLQAKAAVLKGRMFAKMNGSLADRVACFERAFELYRNANNMHGMALALDAKVSSLSLKAIQNESFYPEVIEPARQALALYEQLGDSYNAAMMASTLGRALEMTRDFDHAAEAYGKAADLAAAAIRQGQSGVGAELVADYRRLQGGALLNVHDGRSRAIQAFAAAEQLYGNNFYPAYEVALAQAEAMSDNASTPQDWGNVVETYHRAIAYLRRVEWGNASQSGISRLERARDFAVIRHAESMIATGDVEEPLRMLHQVYDRRIGNNSLASDAAYQMGRGYAKRGNWVEAVGRFKDAMNHAMGIDDYGRAHPLTHMGNVGVAFGNFLRALEQATTADPSWDIPRDYPTDLGGVADYFFVAGNINIAVSAKLFQAQMLWRLGELNEASVNLREAQKWMADPRFNATESPRVAAKLEGRIAAARQSN